MKSILIILTLINLTGKSHHGITLENQDVAYKIEATTKAQNDYPIRAGMYRMGLHTEYRVFVFGVEACDGDSIHVEEGLKIEIRK